MKTIVRLGFIVWAMRHGGMRRLENRQWNGEIVAKGKGDTVRFHVV